MMAVGSLAASLPACCLRRVCYNICVIVQARFVIGVRTGAWVLSLGMRTALPVMHRVWGVGNKALNQGCSWLHHWGWSLVNEQEGSIPIGDQHRST